METLSNEIKPVFVPRGFMKSERLKRKRERERKKTTLSLHHSKLKSINYGVFIS